MKSASILGRPMLSYSKLCTSPPNVILRTKQAFELKQLKTIFISASYREQLAEGCLLRMTT